ncbi:LD-carboxypeptidase [Pseudoalteromonas sp. MMG013]|uniref:S66 family peptidase n=1 Tax=Pseudoalteromonas sp. MMG013 TaxID=2822687 RepID=UPI001B359340|nr:S66 peptidase family protein [Pseudoalteromonas sp. MMG013]MBQ4863294.1 LD-carboxypeptidase [Pseudoalteromonas sp. MMG013]
MKQIKPKSLTQGATLAIVSPSWGGPSIFPHIYQMGIKNLTAMGFNIVEYPSAKAHNDHLFANPKMRADDINAAFANTDVDGIIATIGGSDSARLLQYLDLDTILANPKFFMGFSDITTITTYLNQHGLVTFNGPSIMAGFAQLHNHSTDYQRYLAKQLLSAEQQYVLPTFSQYHHGYPDWHKMALTGQLNSPITNPGPTFVQGTGRVRGQLFGGCIEVLEMLKGTKYWPKPHFWHNKVLFLETSEDKPSIDYVRYWLRNYGVMGVFEQLSGLMIGRPRDYNADEQLALINTVQAVVKDEFNVCDLPIICNLDFGHTDPQLILPLGVTIELDCEGQYLSLVESAFQ